MLATGTKSGYRYTFSSESDSWKCLGEPEFESERGDRSYFVDQTGVIRFNTSGNAAGPEDRPLDRG